MHETQLKIRHAQAVRNGDTPEIRRTEKELEKMGVVGEWLSETVLVWRDNRIENKKVRKRSVKTTDKQGCSVCGAPIEKNGKPGRPPTKCLEHR